MSELLMKSDAIISDCGKYRYRLSRKWGEGKACLFIMLNPSTADADRDDPTIRRCLGFARSWGCEQLYVVNLFAVRATDPKDMKLASDPVGVDNMRHIKETADLVTHQHVMEPDKKGIVVCAWGGNGSYMGQSETVLGWLESEGVTPMYLALTNAGQPKHPLYLKSDIVPMSF